MDDLQLPLCAPRMTIAQRRARTKPEDLEQSPFFKAPPDGTPTLEELILDWMAADKDETTIEDIEHLIGIYNFQELEARLRTRIEFGTAGLRGRMEAGFSRMNGVTVIQASQGLAVAIDDATTDEVQKVKAKDRGIVIGHDHRHNSYKFALLTAKAFLNMGFQVWFLTPNVHTPMVPFAVKRLNACGGVMITASHNPAKDNGYKVYWSNACQIISPNDDKIATRIKENLVVKDVAWDTADVLAHARLEMITEETRLAYLKAVSGLTPALKNPYAIKFVYTPMHGVGFIPAHQAVKELGVEKDMITVHAQQEPDPDFPTVLFPNPEEKGALDLAKAEADKEGAKYVLANDPDADRFAAAEKVNGEWKILTGNQLGVLFAAYVMETSPTKLDRRTGMLCSAVSTRMLGVMAEEEGFHFEETLTGFKWLGNRALELEAAGSNIPFAFEEAIGYCFTSIIPDKDGISALTVFLTYLQRLHSQGLTPFSKLEQLYEKYGYFEALNVYIKSKSPADTVRVFEDVRRMRLSPEHNNPTYFKPVDWRDNYTYPKHLAGWQIHYWRDLTKNFDSKTYGNMCVLPSDPTSQMLTMEFDMGAVRLTVRGSGTEPKIKFYIEGNFPSRAYAHDHIRDIFEDLMKYWFHPAKYGFEYGPGVEDLVAERLGNPDAAKTAEKVRTRMECGCAE